MIQRRTPLKRSASPLKRTPLRRVSKKLAKGLRAYSKLRRDFLVDHPNCEITRDGCTHQSTQVHHGAGRGTNLNEIGTWFAICGNCHLWLHANARTARLLGFLT